MNDHSRILLAIVGMAIGPALGAAGSYALGTVRAVARHSTSERRRRADAGQYAAALVALVGFLCIAGGSGVLVGELVPDTEPMRIVAGAVIGVLAFAAAGLAFSRLADTAEEARVRRLPPLPYAAAIPVPRPALPVGSAAPVSAPPLAGEPLPVPPAQRTEALPPSTSVEVEASRQLTPPPDTRQSERGAPAPRTAIALPSGAGNPWFSQPEESEPDESPAPARESAVGPDGAIDRPESLAAKVRPGWIYQDQADEWYLGVGSDSGALLRLPGFTLAGASEPSYPLVIAGTGEIAVMPVGPQSY